jgi:hypothetical protein
MLRGMISEGFSAPEGEETHRETKATSLIFLPTSKSTQPSLFQPSSAARLHNVCACVCMSLYYSNCWSSLYVSMIPFATLRVFNRCFHELECTIEKNRSRQHVAFLFFSSPSCFLLFMKVLLLLFFFCAGVCLYSLPWRSLDSFFRRPWSPFKKAKRVMISVKIWESMTLFTMRKAAHVVPWSHTVRRPAEAKI